MNERISRIVERWFLTETILFQLYCTHVVEANNTMHCPLRVGKKRLEYNPALIDTISDQELETRMRIEMARILLKHPYSRQPENCPAIIAAIASDLVLSHDFSSSVYKMIRPRDFQLQDGQCFEWYLRELMKMFPNAGQNGEAFGKFPNSSEYWQDQAGLWEEDELQCEVINQFIKDNQFKSWGSLPGKFVESVIASLEVKLDYRNILSSFHTSMLSSKRNLTRMRPNRRSGFAQMGSQYALQSKLLIATDVSGSITSDYLNAFFSVIKKFFTYGIERIDVMQFDCELQPVVSLDKMKAAGEIKITGRGGTDFQPVFDYIKAHHEYDGLIILTDGYAPAPKADPWLRAKVLWICDCEKNYHNHRDWMEKSGRVCFMEL